MRTINGIKDPKIDGFTLLHMDKLKTMIFPFWNRNNLIDLFWQFITSDIKANTKELQKKGSLSNGKYFYGYFAWSGIIKDIKNKTFKES